MSQIHVRDLDEKVVERLKRRAKKRGRSLHSEIKNILEQASKIDMETARELADKIRKSFGNRKFSDSTELIREERDR